MPSPIAVPFMNLARHHAPLTDELRAAFDRLLGTSAFILGEEVEGFEREFAEYCGARHCIGVGSGTAALAIMLAAAGIGAGDEVIVPAHTFIATALSVIHAGATPVAVDVDPGTGLIEPDAAGAAVTAATAAILPVHLYGQVAAMGPLQDLARRHGLALFEDAAQAHGASYRGVRAGSLGTAAAFSFYPSKNLGALGDGGAIATDDDQLARRARELRDLGRDRRGRHVVAGHNERLDGIQASILRIKLRHLDRWNENRRLHAAAYRDRLAGAVELLEVEQDAGSVHHLFPIRVADRDELARKLAAVGVATGVHYDRALPDQPALSGLDGADVPVARDWAARELSLPMFAELTVEERESICDRVLDALERDSVAGDVRAMTDAPA